MINLCLGPESRNLMFIRTCVFLCTSIFDLITVAILKITKLVRSLKNGTTLATKIDISDDMPTYIQMYQKVTQY
jgi:hypothetical protein